MHVRDVHFAIGMAVLVGTIVPLYIVRTLVRGRARHARTEADGGSVFLAKSAMELGYWLTSPVVDALAALRITPNMVTLFSLVPALFAGVAFAFGWFGLACALGTMGAFCDLLDGLLARRLGVASDAGEVIDAAVDRYSEIFLLGGILVYYRTHWEMMLVTLVTLTGSVIFSYTTAKAEAMSVEPPRGSMRRAERAVYLLVAAGLTSLSRELFEGTPSHALRELPIIFALMLIGIATNVSSVQRFVAIAAVLRGRQPPAKPDDLGSGGDLVAPPEPPASPL